MKRLLLLSILIGSVCVYSCSKKTDTDNVSAKQRSMLPEIERPVFKKDTFNIKDYGAVGDGVTLNTESINRAIKECSQAGGGVVLVPQGFWLTGPVELQSNVNLSIKRDAILQFTTDFDEYSLVETNYEGLKAVRNQSPISGKNLENIAITGKGVIDGAGEAWRMVKKSKQTASQWKKLVSSGGVVSSDGKIWYPTEKSLKGAQTKDPGVLKEGKTIEDFKDIKDYLRPNMVSLFHCKKVLLEGVTFQNSPAWCIHPFMCEDLTVSGIFAKNPWYGQNGDGIDVESCKNVLIENSIFDVGDDGICMKSGRNEEGRKRGAPTENVIINNCKVYHAHGGFVIGSEMSGGVKNVYVSNCSFLGTDVGLRFKTTRGRGGVVENIHISHINMRNITGDAIRFDMYYGAKDPVPLAGEKRVKPERKLMPVTEETPQFREFYISHVYCNGANYGIFMRGLPEMNIKQIHLDSLVLKTQKGMLAIDADSIYLNHVRLLSSEQSSVISLINSKNMSFNHVMTDSTVQDYMDINGQYSKNITVKNAPFSDIKSKINLSKLVSSKTLKIE